MLTTNEHNAPDVIIRAVKKQESLYNAGAVDTSVTGLITPPRINLLKKKHHKEMTQDVSQSFYALLGSGVHHLLELGATPDMIVEERLYMNIDGWRISGALDAQTVREMSIEIMDYKVTGVYSVTMNEGPKDEWVAQTNLQCMLVRANKPDYTVTKLEICAILRDWSSSEAKRNPDYPPSPIHRIDIPIWTYEEQLEYARDRIAAHRTAAFNEQMGEPVDYCTDDERWVRDDKWIVMKIGGKRATKIYNAPLEAYDHVATLGKGYEVQHRPGTSTRCGYCNVSAWCDQYQTTIKPVEDA